MTDQNELVELRDQIRLKMENLTEEIVKLEREIQSPFLNINLRAKYKKDLPLKKKALSEWSKKLKVVESKLI